LRRTPNAGIGFRLRGTLGGIMLRCRLGETGCGGRPQARGTCL